MIKKEKNKKVFWGREIAAIAIGVILIASVGIVWIGGAIEGAPPVSTYVGSRGPDIPYLLNYQGVLTDSAGDPVPDGTYQMTFGIYDSATGGNLLWSETQNVQVSDGLFNVLLGSVNSIPSDVFCGGADRWIGMKVRDDPEMTPRQRIVSVAYAYAAECAQGIAPGHGLVIKDTDGNVTHRLNANGTSWHAGMETFDGGIEITGPHESPSWKTVITANGGEKTYDENGRLRCEEFPDGSAKTYYEDGMLQFEKGADGSGKSHYADGKLQSEFGADGSVKTYYENGKLQSEFGADGSVKGYYEDGKLCYEFGADGSEKTYDKDGNLKREVNANGDSMQTGTGTSGGLIVNDPSGDSVHNLDNDGSVTHQSPGGSTAVGFNPSEGLWAIRGIDRVFWGDMNGNSGQTGTHIWSRGTDKPNWEANNYEIVGYNAAGDCTWCADSNDGGIWTTGDGYFDYLEASSLTVRGAKSAVVETTNYGNRTTYCEEAAEVYFFDRGEAQLVNGEVTVELDHIFLETVTINATYPMLVQLTLTGDCNGVYVAQRTASNFTVRELNGGNTNAGFMWEAAAKRKGYEDTRLEEVI